MTDKNRDYFINNYEELQGEPNLVVAVMKGGDIVEEKICQSAGDAKRFREELEEEYGKDIVDDAHFASPIPKNSFNLI